MATVCQSQTHRKARDLSTPVYGWFAEGFDPPDLVEARALLGELGRVGSRLINRPWGGGRNPARRALVRERPIKLDVQPFQVAPGRFGRRVAGDGSCQGQRDLPMRKLPEVQTMPEGRSSHDGAGLDCSTVPDRRFAGGPGGGRRPSDHDPER